MRFIALIFIAALTAFPAFAKPDPYFEAASRNLNFREADSYANYSDKRGIEVGVEKLDKKAMKRLLGNDTGKFKLFEVAITNNSNFRVYINRIDINNANGGPYAAVDLSEVVDAIDPGGSGNKDDMRDAVLRTNILNKSLPHAILNPSETAQGLLYVKDKHLNGDTVLYLQIQNLKRVAHLDFTVPLDTVK